MMQSEHIDTIVQELSRLAKISLDHGDISDEGAAYRKRIYDALAWLRRQPMAEATLAIRPGETLYLHESGDGIMVHSGEHQYLVALVTTPPFPGKSHSTSKSFSVVATQMYLVGGTAAWGWISLTSEAKKEIGNLLLKHEAEPNRWYWLLVSPNPNRFEELNF